MSKGPGRLFLAAAFCLAGCGEEDLASVRLKVRGDGAGEVLVSRVKLLGLPEDVLRASSGLTWEKDSAAVELAGGSFEDIDRVRLAGITFSLQDLTGFFRFTARIPAGTRAQWTRFLSPTDGREKLKRLAARAKELPDIGGGPVYKLQVELPGEVIRQSLRPKMDEGGGIFSFGAVQTGRRGKTAYLVLPLQKVQGLDEPEFIWTVEAR